MTLRPLGECVYRGLCVRHGVDPDTLPHLDDHRAAWLAILSLLPLASILIVTLIDFFFD